MIFQLQELKLGLALILIVPLAACQTDLKENTSAQQESATLDKEAESGKQTGQSVEKVPAKEEQAEVQTAEEKNAGEKNAEVPGDFVRKMQFESVDKDTATWFYWGDNPGKFSSWTNHSNRLVPIYTWGVDLDSVTGSNSIYRDEKRLAELYGRTAKGTLNPKADYFDQTDVFHLQKKALADGKKHVFLLVFDGMDWQTTQAAAIYKSKKIYSEGRGSGLRFLDYKKGESGFGSFVCAPHSSDVKTDVNAQVITSAAETFSGYSVEFGGSVPWFKGQSHSYLLGKQRDMKHPYTDSAASATSMNSGIKTYNGSINVSPEGKQVKPIARDFQEAGYAIGTVSSVPFCHATPGCTYANNVTRNDYQDIARDMFGLRSVSHRSNPLRGVDVIIGCGWGETKDDEKSVKTETGKQGANFVPGNKFLTDSDLGKIDLANGGKYLVAQRTEGVAGGDLILKASLEAAKKKSRFFGFFGSKGGHLPYQTADGKFDPTRGESRADKYTPEDVKENPTLAEMTKAAINVLSTNEKGFWLSVEAGDVDWANHNNNIDDSIGAVLSGDDAFVTVVEWVEKNSNWDESVLILTADHGHMLVIKDPKAFIEGPVDK